MPNSALGWQEAIDQNAADGGTLALPIFVFQERIWWGLRDSAAVEAFAVDMKYQQLAAETGLAQARR